MPTLTYNYTQAGQQITRDDNKWGPNELGTAAIVDYGFRPTDQIFLGPGGANHLEFTQQQKDQAEIATRLFSSIANITFRLQAPGSGPFPDNPDLYMSTYSDGTDKKGGFAFLPDSAWGGNVFVNTFGYDANSINMLAGSQGFDTLIHEMGHGLGLQHPGAYNASDNQTPTYVNSALYKEDTTQFSIMSYFAPVDSNGTALPATNATTPLLHDIAALQRLYGANFSARTGSDIYGFNGTAGAAYTLTSAADNFAFAIWDCGGIDTLDFSLYGDQQIITLVAATANQASADVPFSSVGGNYKNVVIAPGVVIENAIGGSGSDQLFGNHVANTLDGRGGADFMSGGQGADTYYVDDAGDSINDIFVGGGDDFSIDKVYASTSFSLMGTSAEDLFIVPAFGDFDLTGNAFVNVLEGTGGKNTIRGNGGGDSSVLSSGDIMRGGDGDDVYYANYQDVVIDYYGKGFDTVYATNFTLLDGQEIEVLAALNGDGPGVNFVGNQASTRFNGTTGVDFIDGGAGNDVIQGNFFSLASTAENTLRGGAGLDVIVGDNGVDYISGGDDADTITAKLGNDVINGGAGGDTIDGGDGVDTVTYGGSNVGVTVALQQWSFRTNLLFGFSTVVVGARNGDAQGDILSNVENIFGSDFADSLVGNASVNTLTGDFGNDRLAGADGNDFLYGEDDSDRLEGGLGNDQLYGDISGSGPYGVPGDFSPGDDILYGDEGNDRLQGGQKNDKLYGGDGNDILIGNEFAGDLNDPYTFASDLGVMDLGGYGLDTQDVDFLAGGAGNDIYYLGGKEDTISEAVNGGTDELRLALHDSSFDLSAAGFENIENMTYLISFRREYVPRSLENPLGFNLIVGTADFVGTGNALANKITGADQFDTLTGLGGNDTLIGGIGSDTLDGGIDNDTLIGGEDGDTLVGGDGIDTLSYSTSTVGVKAAFEALTGLFGTILIQAGFSGGDATGDVVSGFENITGSAAADTLVGSVIDNVLSGGNGDDKLYGKSGADTLYGGAANDTLVGGAGIDFMYGGSGNDTYWVDTVGDVVSEQSSIFNFFLDDGGVDTVKTDLTTYTLTNYIENLVYSPQFVGFGGFTGTGNDLNNVITGGASDNVLSGRAGADTLNGGFGGGDIADYRTSVAGQVNVNLLADTASGGEATGDQLNGIENLYGSLTLRDILIGDNGNNILKGFGGIDSLVGNDGDDFIEGGAGGDAINGGAGANDWASYHDSAVGQVSINLLTATHSGGDAQGDSLFFIENLEGSLLNRDILIGNIVANRILGNGGVDTIQGGDGNDFIDGGTGGDSLSGGAGQDTLSYEKSSDGVTVDLNVALQVSAGDANGDSLFFFENINGSDFGDSLKGNLISNTLRGGFGADALNGGTGSDTLTGGAGADIFRFSDFSFGSDIISDWQDGVDKISIALPLETSFAGLTFAGNGTTQVIVRGFNGTGSAIIVRADAAFTLDASDFLFV